MNLTTVPALLPPSTHLARNQFGLHLPLTLCVGDDGELHLQEDSGALALEGSVPPARHRGSPTTEPRVVPWPGQTGGGVLAKVDVVLQLQQNNVVQQPRQLVVEPLVNNVTRNMEIEHGQRGLVLLHEIVFSKSDLNSVDIPLLRRL